MAQDYADRFEVLRNVYLEDSWVLDLTVSDRQLRFTLDAVLTESHPDYNGPRPGEQYDYRRAVLVVTGDDVRVELSGLPPATDATGETDLGNIDSWQAVEDGWSALEGDWGAARVLRPRVQLSFEADG